MSWTKFKEVVITSRNVTRGISYCEYNDCYYPIFWLTNKRSDLESLRRRLRADDSQSFQQGNFKASTEGRERWQATCMLMSSKQNTATDSLSLPVSKVKPDIYLRGWGGDWWPQLFLCLVSRLPSSCICKVFHCKTYKKVLVFYFLNFRCSSGRNKKNKTQTHGLLKIHVALDVRHNRQLFFFFLAWGNKLVKMKSWGVALFLTWYLFKCEICLRFV